MVFSRVFGPILVILIQTTSCILVIVNLKNASYGCNERNTQQRAFKAIIILEQKHGSTFVFSNCIDTTHHVDTAFDLR